jgi:rhodanese-related sulfurtransferase
MLSMPALDLRTTKQRRGGGALGSGLAALKLPDLALDPVIEAVEPSELEALLAEGATVVVDVRSVEERADGYIAGSVHMPSEHWNRWHTAAGQSPERQELHTDAAALLAEAVVQDKQLLFHCMYSKERAPRAAQAAADAEQDARIAVLTGGFQRLMAQLWEEDEDGSAGDGAASEAGRRRHQQLFESVRREQWALNGRQGLVWKPDLDPLRLDEAEPEPEPEPEPEVGS